MQPRLLAGSGAPGLKAATAAATSDRQPFGVAEATASRFLPLVDQPFAIATTESSAPARLMLAKVSERPMTKNVERFSLIFHGPAVKPLADGIYQFHHPALGSFSIFVNAVGVPAGHRVYQACFSRHVRV